MKISPQKILLTAFLFLFVLFSFLVSYLQTQSILKNILDNRTRTRRTTNNGLVNGESFSACLLIMDDNHRLPEWIAYHYFAMPLRFLVVAVDPHSKTSPTHIFDRWRSSTDLTIVEWTDKNFTDRDLIINATLDDYIKKKNKHRYRQRDFYNKCTQFLKEEHNRTWTSFHDTDEFMVINSDVVPNGTHLSLQPGSILRMVHKYNHNSSATTNISFPSSSSSFPSKEPEFWYSHFNQSACITITRTLFGAVESTDAEIYKDVPSFIDPKQFDTLRYRHRTAANRNQNDGPGKAIIDVSKVHHNDIKKGTPSAHRPLRLCPHPWNGYNALPLGIHHMLGSWESFSFREDARKNNIRTVEKWQERSVLKEGGADDDARPWISGFVQLVGEQTAKYLLQDAGLPPDYKKLENDTAAWHLIDFEKEKNK